MKELIVKYLQIIAKLLSNGDEYLLSDMNLMHLIHVCT